MVDKNEVLRYLGYRGQALDDITDRKISEMIQLCERVIVPRYIYEVFSVSVQDKIYLQNSELVFDGKDIYEHLKNAEKCAVLASTLGIEAERTMIRLTKEDMSSAVIFDAVCTAKIEEITDVCEKEIKSIAESGGYYTNFRYSPGYGDFPIDSGIVQALQCEKKIGLTITENFIMIPSKSVTAVIGFFNREQETQAKKCEICSMRDTCKLRNGGNGCRREEKKNG